VCSGPAGERIGLPRPNVSPHQQTHGRPRYTGRTGQDLNPLAFTSPGGAAGCRDCRPALHPLSHWGSIIERLQSGRRTNVRPRKSLYDQWERFRSINCSGHAAIGLAMISMPSTTQELISWVIIVGVFLGLIYEYYVYSKTKN
jgi:hypothetical protein